MTTLVVGAGPCGIGILRQLAVHGIRAEAYDAAPRPGGTWRYQDNPKHYQETLIGKNDRVKPGSIDYNLTGMYQYLHTNLETKLMGYATMPIPLCDTVPYPDRDFVLKYLDKATEDVRGNVWYNHEVLRVKYGTEKSSRWEATILDKAKGFEFTRNYDHVVIANGHYTYPFIPSVPGLSAFHGHITHSKYYRRPSDYGGKTVVVVGNGSSGYDIVREISIHSLERGRRGDSQMRVVFSERSEFNAGLAFDQDPPLDWVKHIKRVKGLRSISNGTVTFGSDEDQDETVDNVDVIIFATGYQFWFPFFHAEDEPWKSSPVTPKAGSGELLPGDHIDFLDDRQLLFTQDPTLAFAAILYATSPIPLCEVQGRFLARFWSSRHTLPVNPLRGRDGGNVTRDRHVMLPGEDYDLIDSMLADIGQGGHPNERDWIEGLSPSPESHWPQISNEVRVSRSQNKATRFKYRGF